jgi:hypothetical protein
MDAVGDLTTVHAGAKSAKSAEMDLTRAASLPTYVVRLRPEPGVDAVRALRGMLKQALRRFGLRAVEVREEP